MDIISSKLMVEETLVVMVALVQLVVMVKQSSGGGGFAYTDGSVTVVDADSKVVMAMPVWY